MKLNVKAMALACGLIWGLALFSLSWWLIVFDGAREQFTSLVGSVYLGYSVTPAGSFVGLVWGFFDGLIGGAIFAWLYNLIAGRSASGQS